MLSPREPTQSSNPGGCLGHPACPLHQGTYNLLCLRGFSGPQNGSTHALLVGVLIWSLSSPLFSQTHGVAGRVRDIRRRPADGQRLTARQHVHRVVSLGNKPMEKTHCHCLSSFCRFCFFTGKSQQCSKQLHEYTDWFWQLPISKECVHAIPDRLSPWEFLVWNKPFFIRENTHTWTDSSCWLL